MTSLSLCVMHLDDLPLSSGIGCSFGVFFSMPDLVCRSEEDGFNLYTSYDNPVALPKEVEGHIMFLWVGM